MSELTVKDFEGLSVAQLKKKLQETKDIQLLSRLEAEEAQQDNPRSTALAAINERQGELIEESQKHEQSTAQPPAPPQPPTEDQPDSEKDSKDPDAGTTGNPTTKSTEETDQPGPPPPPEKKDNDDDKVLRQHPDAEAAKAAAYKQAEETQKIYRDDLIGRVRKARLRLDRQLELVKGHLKIDTTPERPLFLAKGWLGKLLGFFGATNPYHVKGGIQNHSEIPATAEKFEGQDARIEVLNFGNKNALPAVLELREELEEIIKFIEGIDIMNVDIENPREASICRTQAWVNACEARFYLGEILSSLRPA